jgi:hypothetical protein
MQCTNKYTKKLDAYENFLFGFTYKKVHARRKQWSISCLETLMAKIVTIELG